MRNIFNEIRTSCRRVAEKSALIRINYDLISDYASQLPVARAESAEIDPNRHYLGHGEDSAAFLITLDTVNFGSGYFPCLKKKAGMSGYFTIASCLNQYFIDYGPLSAEQLSALSTENCAQIFEQDLKTAEVRELMQLFADALNHLGRFLLSDYAGSFMKLIYSADYSAEKLVNILIRMPFFKDTATYKGKNVYFYKRAQLTAADLATGFKGLPPGRFIDLEQLTIFADNLVPHVLRIDQILDYDHELAARIDSGELIASGSVEEIEIRACAVHAVELIKK
jgi:hypothetical protein